MFGDYYWLASHHTDKYKGINGFRFTRIYLTYDHELSEGFSARAQMEAAQSDFTTAAATKMTPFFKAAYLQWKYQGPHSAYFGLSASPTWEEVEGFWGYRSVAKTPLDLQKWGSSRDSGLALKGKFGQDAKFGYHAMVGNGVDTNQETNKNKKLYLALNYKPVKAVFLEAYGDYENNKSNTPGSSVLTLQGFAGVKGDWGRLGVQYAKQMSERSTADALHRNLFSAFLVGKFHPKWSGFARWDLHANPNPDLSSQTYFGTSAAGNTNANTAKNTFLLFGLDHSRADGRVHLMPNVEVFRFGKNDKNFRPVDVVIPKLTVHYTF
jgi:hypothetical protein